MELTFKEENDIEIHKEKAAAMALAMKTDGGPNQRFFEASETVAHFDSVRSWLTRNCKKVCLAWFIT